MADLVRMTRGEGEVAYVRLEWIAAWSARGWRLEDEPVPKRRGRPRKVAA